MEIDATPFDVLVRLDNGVVDRCELVGMVDVATRSITAAVLRPTTKSVDAALLLARSVTPAPMRPGWPEALRMEHSLRLHRHPGGTLPGQAKYLHQRTGGSISSLSHLIRAAAISAIIDGSERISRRLLDSVPVDHSTQSDNPAPSDDEDDGIGDAA
ncbi:hypothetical protein ABZ408_40580 [Streptomyces tibetensis]